MRRDKSLINFLELDRARSLLAILDVLVFLFQLHLCQFKLVIDVNPATPFHNERSHDDAETNESCGQNNSRIGIDGSDKTGKYF